MLKDVVDHAFHNIELSVVSIGDYQPIGAFQGFYLLHGDFVNQTVTNPTRQAPERLQVLCHARRILCHPTQS